MEAAKVWHLSIYISQYISSCLISLALNVLKRELNCFGIFLKFVLVSDCESFDTQNLKNDLHFYCFVF